MKNLTGFLILKIGFCFLIFNSLFCFAGERATREECIEKTGFAISMIEKEGLKAVASGINKRKSPLIWKNTYVCLMDTEKAIFIGHPYMHRSLMGQSLINEKDFNGKEYLKECINVANSKGKGWVQYIYPDKNGVVREKMSYVLKSEKTNVIALAGIYSEEKVEGPKVEIRMLNCPI